MAIKGQLQQSEINKYGFPRIKVSGSWYGADKKAGSISVSDGDIVEFEAYKNDRGYDTFKLPSLKKLATEAAVAASKATPAKQNVKDAYWEDKEARDVAKEPRLAYFGAAKLALQFVDLALRNAAIDAFAKAKPTAKLEVLQALVFEQTQRLIAESYAQEAPTADTRLAGGEEATPTTEDAPEGDDKWK